MASDLTNTLYQKILILLPDATDRIILQYQMAAQQTPSDDAKEFAQQQTACKAALVHLDTLLKLTRWISDENSLPKTKSGELIESVLERAKVSLKLSSFQTEAEEN